MDNTKITFAITNIGVMCSPIFKYLKYFKSYKKHFMK